MHRCLLVVAAACGSPTKIPLDAGDQSMPPDALVSLDPTPGSYRETCDGSGATAIDFEHFLDVNDENQGLRVYRRASTAGPVQQLDISAALGLDAADEADLEDLARVDDRIYAITSHGRNKDGELRPERYRFAALDLTGAVPDLGIAVAGSSSTLLDDMLDAANWDTPDAALIAALDASSQLADPTAAELAPEDQGTNIEGLAALPNGTLVIGFRNPRPGNAAIVVTLTNPAAVVAGEAARFGAGATLELDGLGIRSMVYSPAHGAVLIIAGPTGTGGPFRLYRWSGALGDGAVPVTDLLPPTNSAPEVVVAYPGTKDVQIIFDQGDAMIAGQPCKDSPVADRVFTDLILQLD